ncbi:YceH family protein [Vibrio kyushuensis]|uniref:YceH family protein n=1 Tax=Vibrio kyushuensis TaxID=2910249 RepID=UPI003D0FCDCB
MTIELSPIEARIIGCLIEKEVTTPDYYPLTLNSLTTACNQKSNRDPVLAISDAEVQDTLEALISKRLVNDESAFNSRTKKYIHRFCNTEFGDLKFTDQERGIVCCLLLRGAQTPGELRTRTNRLCQFTDVKEVEAILDAMSHREAGALVVKLPREAGKRESRYQHLFSGEVDIEALVAAAPTIPVAGNSRIDQLETEVSELKNELASQKLELAELKELIDSLTS